MSIELRPDTEGVTDSPLTQIGDLLLTFDLPARSLPGRAAGAGWRALLEGRGWRLDYQEAGDTWLGSPLSTGAIAGWRFWLLGELYALAPGETVAGQIAALLTGQASAATLNGHFLLCALDEAGRRWHFWSDRLGTFHAYYASRGRTAAIGTFSPAVAAAASSRQLDWPALTAFFALGYLPQDRTHFRDLRIFRPASHYEFDFQGQLLRQERYWNWPYRPDGQRNYQETVEEFASVFAEVMADHLQPGRIALPVSGGLDSRSTVAALPADSAGANHFWAYSYGYGHDSVETNIARQVAAARRLPFRAFSIPDYLFEKVESVTVAVEGFQDITQTRQVAILADLEGQADFLIAAHMGDVWLDDMGFTEAGADSTGGAIVDRLVHKLKKPGHQWLADGLCRPQLPSGAVEPLLHELVGSELARLAHLPEADFQVKAFKTDQWSGRWSTASLRTFQAAVWPRLPFYDARIVDFFMTVPTEYVRQRQLQIDYIKQFAPDLAAIRWQVYGANLYHYHHFNSWLLPRRAARKLWRTIRRRSVTERNWEVQFLNEAGRRGLEHWLLRPGRHLHEFVSPGSLRQLLADFYTAPLEQMRGYTVSMLLTFSVWLEMYG